jgi:hypothetical protein
MAVAQGCAEKPKGHVVATYDYTDAAGVLLYQVLRLEPKSFRQRHRWFAAWSEPYEPGGKPRIAAARMAIIVPKTALSFGKACRLPGCAEFKATFEVQGADI